MLEGTYAKMTELGLPLSLAVELQCRGLRLDSSLWTARLSNGGYSVSLFWPSQRHRPRRRRRRRKPGTSLQLPNPITTNIHGTPSSSRVQKTNLLTGSPSKAHLGRKPATSQADTVLVAAEDSDPELTNPSCHNAMESLASGPEETAKQTCPSPAITDSDSEGEGINLKSCLEVHYEKRDGVHGVLVHDEKDQEEWTPVRGRRKKVRRSEVQLRRFPAHCRPTPLSDTDTSSSDSDVPLSIPNDAKVKYSVIDGTPGLSIATNRIRTWTPIALRTRARTKNSVNS